MISILALWLPILLSAILVFVASSVIHMALRYHASDMAPLPGEEGIRAALRQANVAPGDYVTPWAASMKAMSDPAYLAKQVEGPVATLTIHPKGPIAMGPLLLRWFIFIALIGVMVAYIAGRTLAPGTEYLRVFQVTGAVAFLAYGPESWLQSIWWGRKWSTTLKNTFDALVYALLTAGAFAAFWP